MKNKRETVSRYKQLFDTVSLLSFSIIFRTYKRKMLYFYPDKKLIVTQKNDNCAVRMNCILLAFCIVYNCMLYLTMFVYMSVVISCHSMYLFTLYFTHTHITLLNVSSSCPESNKMYIIFLQTFVEGFSQYL